MRLPSGGRSRLGEEIKRLRKERHWTQEDLEKEAIVGQSTISALERGRQEQTSIEYLRRLASAFGISVNVLLRAAEMMDETDEDGPSRPALAQPVLPIAIPVYDQPVSAGRGVPAIQEYLYFAPDTGISSSWYGLPVQGACMIPVLYPGDVVIVNPDSRPDVGDMVVAQIDQEAALVKWLTKHRGQYFLEPEDGTPPLPYDEERMRIVGVVMQMWRNVRRKPRRDYQSTTRA